MAMDPNILGPAWLQEMIDAGSEFQNPEQEAATLTTLIASATAIIYHINTFYSGGGGTSNHADLTNRAWDVALHSKGTTFGIPKWLAAWNASGDPVSAEIGVNLTATTVGADPTGTAAAAIVTHLGAAPHVALSSSTPQPLGTAAAGSGTTSARTDHVHEMPDAADVGALALDGSNSPTANLNMGGYRIGSAGSAVSGSDLPTLAQVQALIVGLAWQDPVISATTGTPPGSPSTGDRYIVPVGAGGAWTTLVDLIVEWDGATWVQTQPAEGWTVPVQDTGADLRYDDAFPAGTWVNLGASVDHAALINRAWASSGHTGTASRLAGFDGSGVAAYYQIGADVQGWSAALDDLATAWDATNNVLASDGIGIAAEASRPTGATVWSTSARQPRWYDALNSCWISKTQNDAPATGTIPYWAGSAFNDLVSTSVGRSLVAAADAATAFAAIKQDATNAASGVVEYATWAESQGTALRVEAANALWQLYDPRRPLWGRFSHLVFKNAVTGFGVWDSPTVTGTFTPTSQASGTYGGWRRVTCTTTARGWYAGNTSSLLTWDLAPFIRCRFWLGTGDTTSAAKVFGALATVTTGPAEVIAAESATTRCVRFGIDGNAFKGYNADGAARTVTNFTNTPSNNVLYCFEIVMLRNGTIRFSVYSWTLDAGLVLIEAQVSNTNVPTGSTALWTGYWCASASGTPTVMFGDAECVLNLE